MLLTHASWAIPFKHHHGCVRASEIILPPQSITTVKAFVDAPLEPSESHSFLSRFKRGVVENSVVIPSITYESKQKEYRIVCENPTFRSYSISKGFILGDVSNHEGKNCDSDVYPLLDVIYEIE